MSTSKQITNYLTVDVEDYYQVSAFEKVIDTNSWNKYESRVEQNTEAILDILSDRDITATFFVVGWIAKKYPDLIRKIVEKGHEIGCHSYWHKKIYDLTPAQFKEDTTRAKSILEDISGKLLKGYRAPSYSITRQSLWALDILADIGFEYDSSIFPTYHDNYGIPDAPRYAYKIDGLNMMEFPISTIQLIGRNIPISGGGYFRLFPYAFTKTALKHLNKNEGKPFIFYIHPWEIDPSQPRIRNAGAFSKFRHYVNLETTLCKFHKLLMISSSSPYSHKNENRHFKPF